MKFKKITTIIAAGAMIAGVTAADKAVSPATKPVIPAVTANGKVKDVAKTQDLWGFLPAVVAKVNGKDITKKEFVSFIESQIKGPDGKMPPMITADLLKRVAPMQIKAYVDQMLLLDAAEKAGFKPAADGVKAALKEQLSKLPKEQREMIKMQLQMTGKSEDAYIDEMAKNPMAQKSMAIEKYLEKMTAGKATVTPAEVQAYYDKNADRFKEPGDAPDQVRASHILISLPEKATAEDDTKAKAKAEAVLAKIKAAPAKFGEIAKAESACPSKAQNGSLGAFGKGQMVKEFEDAAYGLKENEISGLVKTKFGYHIIRRDAAVKERKLPFAEVKERLAEGLKTQKMQQEMLKVIEKLEKDSKFECMVKAPEGAPAMPQMMM